MNPFSLQHQPSTTLPSCKTQIHGHYLVEPPPSPDEKPLVVVFHGYGQNAAGAVRVVQNFTFAADSRICAPQGFNLFYGKNGEVVANWFTSLSRFEALCDSAAFVETVIERIIAVCGKPRRLCFFAFSQGAPVASLVIAQGKIKPQALVVIAGDIAPHLSEEQLRSFPPTLLCAGLADTIMPIQQIEGDLVRLQRAGVQCEIFKAQCGHEISTEYVEKVDQFVGAVCDNNGRK